jgi:uncharacterized membrane protein
MGWWKIEYWRMDKNGNKTTEMKDEDLQHIAELIKEGYNEGEVNDEESD